MSASLLEKVAPGPWGALERGTTLYKDRTVIVDVEAEVVAVVNADDTAEVEDGAIVEVLSLKAKANAQLLALAYDHALLLSALAQGYAIMERGQDGRVFVSVLELHVRVELDAFDCSALTPELRAALRAALGLP